LTPCVPNIPGMLSPAPSWPSGRRSVSISSFVM
jgi:hypothetical protein